MALLHVLLIAAIVAGQRAGTAPEVAATLQAIQLTPVASPLRQPAALRHAAPRRRGAAAKPNLRSHATPVVAPPPAVVLPAPPVIVVAPLPGIGADATAGAAPVMGPGSGSGGSGTGTGSSDAGIGDGGGGGGIPLRLIHGRIRDSDYPAALAERGIGGTVGLRFVVRVDGRVGDCTVTASSGSLELDALTCRLIRERFRYRPTRDATGRKVPDVVTGEHRWTVVEPPADKP